MTSSPTAKLLSEAIDRSPLTQREIAQRAGFRHPNVLSMLKSGETKVPLERIPGLCQALGIDQYRFLYIAMEEYNPEVWRILEAVFGLPLTEDEVRLLGIYRFADLCSEVVLDDVLCAALEAVFELERHRREGG